MEDISSTQVSQQPPMPMPNPALKRLDVLVGTWDLKGRESGPYGEIHGQVRFEWMEGGYFLVQHVDINHIGHQIKGIEIIGYGRGWDGITNKDCTSSYFDSEGNAFTYVWDVEEDTLTIWGGQRGSPAHFKGDFSGDRNTITGAWEWPGGGYEATLTRVKD